MLNFSMYQSGIDFKCPYSNRPLKTLTPSIGLTQYLFSGTKDPQNPLICLPAPSAIDLYRGRFAGSHLQVPWHNAVWRHDGTGRAQVGNPSPSPNPNPNPNPNPWRPQVEALTDAARTNSISLERRNTLSAGRMLQLDPAQYASMT
jgi:hypothetical protein